MTVTKKELRLWEENNKLNDSILEYVKILAEQEHLRLQETVHHGYDAVFITSGLETYKIVINTDEFKLNLLGKNKVRSDKDYFHHVKDFAGEDSWIEAVQYVGGLVRKKGSECLCKRFYRKV